MRSAFTVLALFFAIRAIAQNTFPSSGNVGIGTTSPVYSLDVVAPASTWKAQFRGPDGYILIGPANPSWAHIYTDRPNFIFNQGIWSATGVFSSYAPADLTLQTNGTGRLTISNSTGYVGIGTSSPTAKLHLAGTGDAWTTASWGKSIEIPNGSVLKWAGNSSGKRFGIGQTTDGLFFVRTSVDDNTAGPNYDMFIANSGNVGIGTYTPYSQSTLHVKAPGATPWGILSEARTNQRIIGLGHDGNAGVIAVSYLDASGYSPLNFNTSNLTRMSIAVNGSIGIGTSNPDQLLTVKGIVHAQEVRVDLSVPGPDYVFEKNYRLPTLKEVKDYIDQNRHLPEMPSAAEMERNGLQLGEMNMLLLKKMEEMTLYILDQQKQIEALKSRMETIRNKTE